MEKNFLTQKKFLLTSLNYVIKSPKKEELKEELKTISHNSFPFRTINYNNILENKKKLNKIFDNDSKKEKLFIRNMKSFVAPINKTKIEKNKLNAIKNNLIKKKFKELHKYMLKINPKNYYHTYGLNKYIIIMNKNKSRNNDYRYNNISSYNNIFKFKTTENKRNIKIIKTDKKEKKILLKSLPYRLINTRNNKGILKFFNKETLTEENSIWRGKNINDMIHNSINFDFINIFNKNYRSMGKLKFHK